MLNTSGRRVDHAGHDDLVLTEVAPLHRPLEGVDLVDVTGIRSLDENELALDLSNNGPDLIGGEVLVVGT